MTNAMEDNCHGQIFKADVQNYIIKRGFGFAVRMRKIKKFSCPGCERCGWQHGYISDMAGDGDIQDIESVEHGKLYALEICDEEKNPETGIVETWYAKLVRWEQPK